MGKSIALALALAAVAAPGAALAHHGGPADIGAGIGAAAMAAAIMGVFLCARLGRRRQAG